MLLPTASEIVQRVKSGEWSASDIVADALTRIATQNQQLGAFTQVTEERARHQAAAIDRKIRAGEDPGPLAGVPFAVKNLFDIQGVVTLAGSRINQDDRAASYDATLVSRLHGAGAILLGALNMGEYAYDFTGENVHYGPSRNPHDRRRMSGGSSGGSAAAVAGGLVPLALGSDTNGSIRVPSSLCGIFGLKPTYGRLSRAGTFPFCSSLDHVGPMARSATDLALAYDALQGFDSSDPVSVARPVEPSLPGLQQGHAELRMAVAGGYFGHQGSPVAAAAVQRVANALGVQEAVEIPAVAEARAAAYLITNAESSAIHLENLRQRAGDYDPDVRDRMLAGALLPAAAYLRAQRFRSWFQKEMARVFERFDVLIAPATPMTAPLLGQKSMELHGETMLVRPHLGLYTQPFSFVGVPVAVVPVFMPGELPIGVQIVAAPWQESRVLRVAAALEGMGFTSSVPQI